MAWLQQSCNVVVAMARVVWSWALRMAYLRAWRYEVKCVTPLQGAKTPLRAAVPWPLLFPAAAFPAAGPFCSLLCPCFGSSCVSFLAEQVAGGVPLRRTRGRPRSWAGVREHTGRAAVLSSAAQSWLQLLRGDLFCLPSLWCFWASDFRGGDNRRMLSCNKAPFSSFGRSWSVSHSLGCSRRVLVATLGLSWGSFCSSEST